MRTEFWAVGFRNPGGSPSIRPPASCTCGDVGQSAREEIDIVEKGKNYGWAFREGNIAAGQAAAGRGPSRPIPSGTTAGPTGKSIIGGVVYRGSPLPELSGAYIFGDYVSGNIWALQGSGPYTVGKLAVDTGPASFGVDPRNGDVLIATFQATPSSGWCGS